MSVALLATAIVTALVLIYLGYALEHKKAYWLISGYNTMPEEKKEKIDIEGLASFMARMLYAMGGMLFLAFLFLAIGLETLGMILILATIPSSSYFLIKAQKFDGNTKNKDGTYKTKTKVFIGAAIVSSLAILIGIGVLFYMSNKPAEFIIQDHTLEIKGMYGESIDLENVAKIELYEKLPPILARTNGSDTGSMKKGKFKLQDIGNAKLFVNTEKPPFIMLQDNSDKVFFINTESQTETEELYQELIKLWEEENQ